MLLLTLPLAFAPLTDWHVDVQGTAPGSGTLADPYTSIEYAIAQPTTVPGDRILVAPGTYTGETIDFLGKELSIEAAQGLGTVLVQGPRLTHWDLPHAPGSGGQALIRVTSGEGPGTLIKGIEFQGGAGEDLGSRAVGGALYLLNSNLTMQDCIINGAAHTLGGAIYSESSNLTCVNVDIDGLTLFPTGTGSMQNVDPPVGGAIAALWSSILLVECELFGISGYVHGSDSPDQLGMMMHLEDCTTRIDGGSLRPHSLCIGECLAPTQIEVNSGSLIVSGSQWIGNPGQTRLFHVTDASVELDSMLFEGNYGWFHGRVLQGSGLATITQCTFLNGGFALGVYAPTEVGIGGQISFQGSLTIDQCHFEAVGNIYGGAIGASLCNISNSTFIHNGVVGGTGYPHAYGGAIHAGTATITNCVFIGNSAHSPSYLNAPAYPQVFGGAIFLYGGSIQGCTFEGNHVSQSQTYDFGDYRGGAIYAVGEVSVEDCEFLTNRVAIEPTLTLPIFSYETECRGGAIYFESGGTVRNSRFYGNRTASNYNSTELRMRGGAIYVDSGEVEVTGCEFIDNESIRGSAVYVESKGTVTAKQTLFDTNRLIPQDVSQESPQGPAWMGAVDATQCTITGHDASSLGATVFEGGSLDSCIYWGNLPSNIPAGMPAQYSTLESVLPPSTSSGPGNSDEDPLFWAMDDLHLLPASPAIDAGNPALFDDDGSRADRGAYAFDPAYCGTLCAQPLGSHPCDSNPNSSGATATIAAFGSADVSDQFLSLSATQVPENSIGYFLTGQFGGFVPLFNGSAGNLCLGGQIYRMHDTLQTANAGNRIGRRVDMMDLAYGNVILPGSTWHFQFWFRDHGSMTPATNTSGSVAIQF